MTLPIWIAVLVLAVLLLVVGYLFLSWQEVQDKRFDGHYNIIVAQSECIVKLQKDVARLEQDNITILEKAAEFNDTEMQMIGDMAKDVDEIMTELNTWREQYKGYFAAYQAEYERTHK